MYNSHCKLYTVQFTFLLFYNQPRYTHFYNFSILIYKFINLIIIDNFGNCTSLISTRSQPNSIIHTVCISE